MSIVPLPVFEADADPSRRSALTDEEIYARLGPPATIVVRFGSMRMIGEFPYEGTIRPGCGTKLVLRTVRGTELGEMLTTTCSNSGCSKTISRQEMLEYIQNSGGNEFPFHEHGRVLRVATIEDLNRWSAVQGTKSELLRTARAIAAPAALPMKIVEVEPILGGEMATIYYLAEERIDFRDLLREFASAFSTRIEMRQVGARDEARLVADYERCGQHCCCKNFLKVLKPVSIKSAKIQKATLDPLKISGRCGRLMCCLRYEDQTYEELKARMPRMKSRVGTAEGPGVVVDQKILVQLVLVRLEADGRELAVPVEELIDPAASERLRPPPSAERSERPSKARGGPSEGRVPTASRGGEGARPDAARERLGLPEGAGRTGPEATERRTGEGPTPVQRTFRDRLDAERDAEKSQRSTGREERPSGRRKGAGKGDARGGAPKAPRDGHAPRGDRGSAHRPDAPTGGAGDGRPPEPRESPAPGGGRSRRRRRGRPPNDR
ncbi:MAG TPA: regulatory iron-sulfur-containing complex subunit RicT [Phycisphaerales bacterium]|nr:regulatory iron-sulfur-containing complex subunit RicT [Phycisphaerales bacterium]HMP38060.1 regulatory iron-sulfur-containing complex subunit RicT [Phycisphaerales bacterium]